MRTHHSTRRGRQFGTHERSRHGRSTSTSRRSIEVAPRACDPRQDLCRLHPRPRRPGRVVDRHHEGRAVDPQGPDVATQLVGDHLVPAGEDGLEGGRRGRHAEALQEPRHAVARRVRGPARASGSSGAQRLDRRRTRATAIPGGRGDAVVRIDWPAGSSATRARLRTGSSSENTSSSRRVGATGVRARTSSWIARRRARARQRCSPCDAWVRASRPSRTMTRSSRCGPDRVDAAPQVVGPRCLERVEEVALPAALVVLLDHGVAGPAGQSAVGAADERGELEHQALARRDEHLARVGQALVPHVERRGHVRAGAPARLAQQRGALAQHTLGLVRRPRAFRVEQGQRVVEQVAASPRPAADQHEVVGREDRARRGGGQHLAPAGVLAVHPGAAAPGRMRSPRPPGRCCRACRTSARTIATSAPTRTIASGGAPRNDRRVPR